MHCKHCGNQIENDSKFCSFCGGKIDPIGQTIPTQQPLTQVQPETILTPTYEKSIPEQFANAFLVIAIIDFGFRLFWNILQEIARNGNSDIYTKMEVVTTPLWIINTVITSFLCFLYSKKKEHKTVILIIGVVILGWGIYANYLRA
jgi:hypothetical protein